MILPTKSIIALGLMSGTSLDGLDLACCQFVFKDKSWSFKVLAVDCISYSEDWKESLSNAYYSDSNTLKDLDKKFGSFLGEATKKFIRKYNLQPDLIASHGHTIFHQPEKGITLQIGKGQIIADTTGILTINNFREADVKKGGQGAPLVPVGDKYLFTEFGICLNIGGIANLSFEKDGKRIAFDICPANQALNFLSAQLGYDFDKGGKIAESGIINTELLEKLNKLAYYNQAYPKSLGREWFEENFLALLNHSNISLKDQLRTTVEHIASQIAKSTTNLAEKQILITGGGAFNQFLVSRIMDLTYHKVVVPNEQIIAYKEAIVFAFIGVLRYFGQINCMSSVTGASEDSSTGDIHTPSQNL